MNAKKCKAIRRIMRLGDSDPRDARYVYTKAFPRHKTIVLNTGCGRYMYKHLKSIQCSTYT